MQRSPQAVTDPYTAAVRDPRTVERGAFDPDPEGPRLARSFNADPAEVEKRGALDWARRPTLKEYSGEIDS